MAKLTIATMDGPIAPTADAAGLADYVKKGDIVQVYDDSIEFGRKEVLPTIIRATITDRSAQDVQEYLSDIKEAFTYTIVGQNAFGVRASVTVDAEVSGSFAPAVKQDVKNYVLMGGEQGLSVTLFTQTANSLTVDIALPNDATRIPTLQAFRDDINDKFSAMIRYRRYYFNSAAVDTVVSSGGIWTGTATQAVANIVDRFVTG